jgi:hypothetical protein
MLLRRSDSPGCGNQGRTRDRQTVVRALIVPLAVVILAAGCTSGSASSAGTHVPPTAGSVATTRPPAQLSTRLVLASTTVTTGAVTSGRISVENNTGRAISAAGCGGIFQVLLTNNTYRPAPVWPACLQTITIPPGRSSYPVSIEARYNQCGSGGPSNLIPACSAVGPPPLPPGEYEARTFELGDAVPIPATVAVSVTA